MTGTTMWYEQFDWPESEPNPSDLKQRGITFKWLVYQMMTRVIETLEKWLDAPLSEAEKYTCAVCCCITTWRPLPWPLREHRLE